MDYIIILLQNYCMHKLKLLIVRYLIYKKLIPNLLTSEGPPRWKIKKTDTLINYMLQYSSSYVMQTVTIMHCEMCNNCEPHIMCNFI